ncbi:Phage protein Gp37/Gp68 [Pirellula sp. SH-Sr6A]|uniref:DUF5131 family protein n=1 Tax=Pirellula sp. SH-Sr6A TaxID=1632865 RepID=UPI00078B9798|nr:DUF5131 family protein [Pirellula sp. SH-Sr6A]AMV31745.1 Phage protein Gp37/Gp68 [Pirellula sp. SH-Sr6A]
MENTKIEWATHTFNPWMGCVKVSPACKYCYAERDMDRRLGIARWGEHGTRVVTGEEYWRKPMKWEREAREKGVRYRVFCASLADVFEDWTGQVHHSSGVPMWRMNVPDGNDECWGYKEVLDDPNTGTPLHLDDIRRRLFQVIDATPSIDWLLLTKRPENIPRFWPSLWVSHPMPNYMGHADRMRSRYRTNVWLGTSVENQEFGEKRLPELMKCRKFAPVLFLSCEPLLGPVDLRSIANACRNCDDIGGCDCDYPPLGIDWVIAGGESGLEARPSHPAWFQGLSEQCKKHNVPFLFKQWGEWLPASQGGNNGAVHEWPDGEISINVGKHYAGRKLDGEVHDEFPHSSIGVEHV